MSGIGRNLGESHILAEKENEDPCFRTLRAMGSTRPGKHQIIFKGIQL